MYDIDRMMHSRYLASAFLLCTLHPVSAGSGYNHCYDLPVESYRTSFSISTAYIRCLQLRGDLDCSCRAISCDCKNDSDGLGMVVGSKRGRSYSQLGY